MLTDETLSGILEPLVPGGINWFPGHMAKAQREISQKLKLVNAVVEVVDARMPASSRHPALRAWIGNKSHIVALTKVDVAENAATKRWVQLLTSPDQQVIPVDAARGSGIREVLAAIRAKKLPARVLVLGVPNSGKSSLINRACGRAAARVGANPGITRGQQWLKAAEGIEFLDTPGLLWPRIDSFLQGLKLAWLASIGENAYDAYAVGGALAVWLHYTHPQILADRYGITPSSVPEVGDLLMGIGRRRGCLISGGEVNCEQAARVLLQDLRTGRLGRLTFDTPPGGGI